MVTRLCDPPPSPAGFHLLLSSSVGGLGENMLLCFGSSILHHCEWDLWDDGNDGRSCQKHQTETSDAAANVGKSVDGFYWSLTDNNGESL